MVFFSNVNASQVLAKLLKETNLKNNCIQIVQLRYLWNSTIVLVLRTYQGSLCVIISYMKYTLAKCLLGVLWCVIHIYNFFPVIFYKEWIYNLLHSLIPVALTAFRCVRSNYRIFCSVVFHLIFSRDWPITLEKILGIHCNPFLRYNVILNVSAYYIYRWYVLWSCINITVIKKYL